MSGARFLGCLARRAGARSSLQAWYPYVGIDVGWKLSAGVAQLQQLQPITQPQARVGSDTRSINSSEEDVHTYFVLDRLGSMETIHGYVIGGCNALPGWKILLVVSSASFLAGRKLLVGTFQSQPEPQLQPNAEPRAPVGTDPTSTNNLDEGAHVYFVLDRSGSMAAIRSDVIGGFNAFVNEQRAGLGRLRMTSLQFDSNDPRMVVFAGRDIKNVPLLTADTFKPGGGTPLYDALGFALVKAEQSHTEGERVVIVTFSDGMENDSWEHTRDTIFARITEKRKLGWTFVFLGANQDAYAESSRSGCAAENTQNFHFDGQGTRTAFLSVSMATRSMRSKLAGGMERSYDSEDFFEGLKLAEDDYCERSREV